MKKPQYVIILIAFGICGLLVWAFSDRFSKSWMVSQVSPLRLQAPLITTTPVSTTALQGLTVQFRANRASYILGEPVVITVTAQNQTAAPLVFNDGFQLIAGLISVQIAKNGGAFLDYSGPFPVPSQEFITGHSPQGQVARFPLAFWPIDHLPRRFCPISMPLLPLELTNYAPSYTTLFLTRR